MIVWTRQQIEKITVRFAVITVAVSLAGGCASINGYPDEPVSPDTELSPLLPYFNSSVMTQYEGLSGAQRQSYRDEVTYSRMRAYDISFLEFEKCLSKM